MTLCRPQIVLSAARQKHARFRGGFMQLKQNHSIIWQKTARRMTSAVALAAALFAGSATLRAQVLTGEIDGTVRDGSGAVVPDAAVTVTNSDENQIVRTVKTNRLGQFQAPLLTIGTYTLAISAQGFEAITLTNIVVHVGQPATVPVTVAVGAATETVDVQASNTTIQLDSAAAGTLINNEEVTQLPLSNRNYLQLLSIQPGITGPVPGENPRGNIRSNGAVNTQQNSVNGNTTALNGYYLDGADTIKRAGQQPVSFPGVDFIQEINLLRGSYGADIGGPGAAVTSVQTKAGTTDFHGGAFAFFRSQIFNANTPLANLAGLPKLVQRAADFGYYIGGPVWIPGVTKRETSKTFFFFGQEYLRETGRLYLQHLEHPHPRPAQRPVHIPGLLDLGHDLSSRERHLQHHQHQQRRGRLHQGHHQPGPAAKQPHRSARPDLQHVRYQQRNPDPYPHRSPVHVQA
jgi:hypothetical protein